MSSAVRRVSIFGVSRRQQGCTTTTLFGVVRTGCMGISNSGQDGSLDYPEKPGEN
jgi:hypothetical protein